MAAPYKTFTAEDLTALRNICGETRVIARDEIGEDFCHDELSGTHSRPDCLVKALSTAEVAAVMKYAAAHNITVDDATLSRTAEQISAQCRNICACLENE